MRKQDHSYSLSGRPRNRVHRQPEGHYEGDVVTPHGIVSVLTQDDQRLTYTRLDFAFQGRHYIRSIYEKEYKGAALTRVAREFADEVVASVYGDEVGQERGRA